MTRVDGGHPPVIGLTLDHEDGGEKGVSYAKSPFYAIRENYCASVRAFGGLPFPLVHERALTEDFLRMIDGLVITGGRFDIDPSLYGGGARHASVTLKEERTRFESDITRGALEARLPILGICGGEQLLNVVLGGTLVQHIPDSFRHALTHRQPTPLVEPGHTVTVATGTMLHRIVGSTVMHVNTAHHQAVDRAAPGTIVNATTSDGVIEGIELPESEHPFCLGVQWHPEYHVDPGDAKLFEAFVAACRMRRVQARSRAR